MALGTQGPNKVMTDADLQKLKAKLEEYVGDKLDSQQKEALLSSLASADVVKAGKGPTLFKSPEVNMKKFAELVDRHMSEAARQNLWTYDVWTYRF